MKKFRDFLSRPTVTAVLLALALVLLGGSTIGGTRAVLNRESALHQSVVKVNNIGVALEESNDGTSWERVAVYNHDAKSPNLNPGSLMNNMLGSDKKLLVGKKYTEMLRVSNAKKDANGIDEYVRVTVYKYWAEADGTKSKKSAEMNSDWIKLEFITGNGWSIDTDSSTEERTVLYYSPILAPDTQTTPFLRSITIDEAATHKVTKAESTENGVTTITWTYDYNGMKFCLDVYVNAVQTHNVTNAKTSAWGVNK